MFLNMNFSGRGLAAATALLLGLAGHGKADAVPKAKDRFVTVNGKQYELKSRLKAILIGQWTFGYDHTVGYPNLEATLQQLGKAEGWKVDTLKDPTQLTAAKLANYQVFFADYISGFGGGRGGGGLSSASQTAVQNFVEVQGNGLFLMHSAGDSPKNSTWPWYSTVAHPCHYTGEAGKNAASTGKIGFWGGVRTTPGSKTHPVMEGINWKGADSTTIQNMELHTFDKVITDPSITPAGWQGLMGLNPSTCATANTCGQKSGYNYSNISGAAGWPISWTFPDKKGTIGYFMEGHDLQTMQYMNNGANTPATSPAIDTTEWGRFWKQFMYWTAGYDSILVPSGINLKQSEMGFNLDRSGITFHPNDVGVFISTPGSHVVSLVDVTGHVIKTVRDDKAPADYNFTSDLANAKHGVYVMRVETHGAVKTKRFLIN